MLDFGNWCGTAFRALRGVAADAGRAPRPGPTARPGLEMLEGRDLMSALAFELSGQGVWLYNNGWQQLTPADASQVAIDNYGDVAGAFPSGVWDYTSSGWQQLTAATDVFSISGRK